MNAQETSDIEASEPEIKLIECKFTVESSERDGGDFPKNLGGNNKTTRIVFEGYMTPVMYKALADAIGEAVS